MSCLSCMAQLAHMDEQRAVHKLWYPEWVRLAQKHVAGCAGDHDELDRSCTHPGHAHPSHPTSAALNCTLLRTGGRAQADERWQVALPAEAWTRPCSDPCGRRRGLLLPGEKVNRL